MLPEPTLSFTLPSIHDDTVLDCRIYHSQSLRPSPNAPPWKRHAAIIAHPYAPLGGCYDDPIVGTIATSLLRLGYLVGTFNFRGASSKAGRTSWTSKPERGDYMSFVGFMTYYVHFLDPFGAHYGGGTSPPPSAPQSPVQKLDAVEEHPVLLLGGYSYGAMIATQLPPLEDILLNFSAPAVGSAAAEIRLRAQHLADQQNVVLGSARAARTISPRKALGMRVGGDEGGNRKSHEARRSFSLDAEEIRRGVNELLAKAKLGHHHKDGKAPQSDAPANELDNREQPQKLEIVSNLIKAKPAYLLVSPLQGVITHLATLSFIPASAKGLFSRAIGKSHQDENSKTGHKDVGPPAGEQGLAAEKKLTEFPTLAIFGDRDGFVPVNKLRPWVARLERVEGSRFHGEEVTTAGHFWVEEKVLDILRGKLVEFSSGLFRDQ